MVCSLDHFLLSSHTLVAIVNLNLMIKWEHACEDIEPRGEGIMWDRYLHMESPQRALSFVIVYSFHPSRSIYLIVL